MKFFAAGSLSYRVSHRESFTRPCTFLFVGLRREANDTSGEALSNGHQVPDLCRVGVQNMVRIAWLMLLMKN